MKRYKTLSPIGKNDIYDYVPDKVSEYPESKVDKTSFMNSVESARTLANRIQRSSVQGLFDTPDDIKRGFKADVYARQKGRDITEINEAIKSLEEDVKTSLTLDVTEFEKQMKTLKDLQSRKDNSVSNVGNSDSNKES